MPFYEYQCPHCGFDQEVLQSINDKPLKKCPSCGKAGLKKLISAPVFRLKGSGWYETDFKSDKENKRNLAGADKEEAKSEAKPDAKSETKSETKAEAKSDAKSDKPEKSAKSEPVKTARRKSAAKSKSKPARKRR
jgi:putative FmdB family regulatory protein